MAASGGALCSTAPPAGTPRRTGTASRSGRLLPHRDGARSLLVHAVTGYWVRFPVEEVDELLLATAVGGIPLTPAHGYPVRLVAPGRRGYWWVKWVDRIELSPDPSWWQPPFPVHLTGGAPPQPGVFVLGGQEIQNRRTPGVPGSSTPPLASMTRADAALSGSQVTSTSCTPSARTSTSA